MDKGKMILGMGYFFKNIKGYGFVRLNSKDESF